MLKNIVISLIISLSTLLANEPVKTSELELFLFKVGFESLLKDVELTKDKSQLNESEIRKINSKIELIMNELYKNNRVLTNDDSNIIQVKDETYKQEIKELKSEVEFLKKQISLLLNNKSVKVRKNDTLSAKVISKEVNIRQMPYNSSKIVNRLKRDTIIDLESCNNYGWCKLKNSEGFIAKFLIDLNY